MTSIEKLYTLYLSTMYIIDNIIKGDFMKCGVWKGGTFLHPKLVENGVLIVDEFGYWDGAKKCILEFLKKQNI